MMSNSDRSEEDETPPYPLNEDPFYQYKPKHPADVNLLATSNVRSVEKESTYHWWLETWQMERMQVYLPYIKLIKPF